MFSVKAKPMPTMPGVDDAVEHPVQLGPAPPQQQSRNSPLVSSSLTGATTASEASSVTPAKTPPMPWTTSAPNVATKAPHSRPMRSRRRGSGS